jgi:dTDP-4-amino-4,6-dideoxygalactose transaminase
MRPHRFKVIIPGYTCWVVPAAVVRAGLEPVACDNAPYSFDYDYARLESLMAPDVLCIVAQHMFGVPADMARLRSLAQGRGILVLEDTAQAMGGKVQGRLLGTMGDVGLFSLGRGKNVSTVSGGILTTNNPEIGAHLAAEGLAMEDCPPLQEVSIFLEALAMACLLPPRRFWLPARLPWLKLGETPFDLAFPIRSLGGVQAALSRHWPDRLAEFCQIRRVHAQYLLTQVAELRAVCPLALADAGNGPRLPCFVADAPAREALLRESARQGLGLALTFPDAVDGIPYFQAAPWRGSLPEAQRLARETITLPIHPLVSPEDLQRIVRLLEIYL